MRPTIIYKLLILNRKTKQLIMILIDSVLIVFALLSAFSMRLGYWLWPQEEIRYVIETWIIFLAPVIAIPIFISFGLYQSIIRYIGVRALTTLVQAVTLYAVIWGLFGYMAAIEGVPRSVILINWMLALITIGGSRILARLVFSDDSLYKKKNKSNVIIYGAGSAGRQLSNALQLSGEYLHVAYIDDSATKDGTHINNIPVFSYDKIRSLIENSNVSEILLALPSISRRERNKIIEKLRPFSVHVRSLPSMVELAQGNVKVEDLREIDIKDLLGRNSIPADKNLLNLRVSGKVVLVTGAGGSIGSELCRQLLLLNPKRLILYDINEYSLYQINFELEDNNNVEFFPILGSVRDRYRLNQLCQYFGVQTIYHAAAYKHVPLVEHNNSEGVLNNIFGTLIAAEVAIENKVETFVFVSTDKAVRPTNTMGATKRVAELVLQALAKKKHNTCFTMVRFGNVLDSSGSVIPLFKQQIKSGGPVTVTDVNIVRYFMTKTEAVELVIQAGAMSNGGDVFVLDMGKPVKIDDLARKMIELSGLTVLDKDRPDGDIEIQYTGLRPGEKLYEELLVNEKANKTDNPLIMTTEEAMLDWEELEPILEQLKVASNNLDHFIIRELLLKAVPEFNPQCGIKDYLYKDKT